MSFQEGKKIHLELRNIITTRLALLDKAIARGAYKKIKPINYKRHLESLPAIGQIVEEQTLQLLELEQKTSVLGDYLIDLCRLTDNCIYVLWNTHKSKSRFREILICKKGYKYQFAFECLYYLDRYRDFLKYYINKTVPGHDPVMLQCKASENISEKLLNTTKQDSSIPFKIALCSEIGLFDTPEFSSLSNKRQREVIQKLIGGSDRIIKGNLAVLNSHSKENPSRYTAIQYLGEVRKFLRLP